MELSEPSGWQSENQIAWVRMVWLCSAVCVLCKPWQAHRTPTALSTPFHEHKALLLFCSVTVRSVACAAVEPADTEQAGETIDFCSGTGWTELTVKGPAQVEVWPGRLPSLSFLMSSLWSLQNELLVLSSCRTQKRWCFHILLHNDFVISLSLETAAQFCSEQELMPSMQNWRTDLPNYPWLDLK